MRGLTAAERAELVNWVSGSVDYSPRVMDALVAAGRVRELPDRFDRTEMGRLALRVCPVGEP